MGSRDYRRRELKKRKKDARKGVKASVLPPTEAVEVIKKDKKERGPEE